MSFIDTQLNSTSLKLIVLPFEMGNRMKGMQMCAHRRGRNPKEQPPFRAFTWSRPGDQFHRLPIRCKIPRGVISGLNGSQLTERYDGLFRGALHRATEGLIKAHRGQEFLKPGLFQLQLGGEELPLGIEEFQVA